MKLFDTRPEAYAQVQPGEWIMLRETKESTMWATVSPKERMQLGMDWISWEWIPGTDKSNTAVFGR